jgi:hypothetical protein
MLRKVSGWVVRNQVGIIGCRCVFDVALVDVGIHRVVWESIDVVVGGDCDGVQKLVQVVAFKNWSINQYMITEIVQTKSSLILKIIFTNTHSIKYLQLVFIKNYL